MNNQNGSYVSLERYIQREVEECVRTFNLFPGDRSLQMGAAMGLLVSIALFIFQEVGEIGFGILFVISIGMFLLGSLRQIRDVRVHEEVVASVPGVLAEFSPEELNTVKRILNCYHARQYKSMVDELCKAREFEKLKKWIFIKEMQRRFRV